MGIRFDPSSTRETQNFLNVLTQFALADYQGQQKINRQKAQQKQTIDLIKEMGLGGLTGTTGPVDTIDIQPDSVATVPAPPAMSLATGGVGNVDGQTVVRPPKEKTRPSREISPFVMKPSLSVDPISGGMRVTYSQVANPEFVSQKDQQTIDMKKQKFDLEQKEKTDLKQKQSKSVKAQAKTMLNSVDFLLDKKNIKQFGVTGPIPAIPGTKKREWLAELNFLKGKQVLNLMTELKQASKTGATGFGQLSEKELALLENSANKLERGLPEKAAKKELNRIKGLLNKIMAENDENEKGFISPNEGGNANTGDEYQRYLQAIGAQ